MIDSIVLVVIIIFKIVVLTYLCYLVFRMVRGMQADGRLSADELSKVVIIVLSVYVVLMQYDYSYLAIMMSALFAIAKIKIDVTPNNNKDGRTNS